MCHFLQLTCARSNADVVLIGLQAIVASRSRNAQERERERGRAGEKKINLNTTFIQLIQKVGSGWFAQV